jgi:HEAT repeat protein
VRAINIIFNKEHINTNNLNISTIIFLILSLSTSLLLISCETDITNINLTRLNSNEPLVKIDAINNLAKTKNIKVIVPLINCLKDNNIKIKEAAEIALENLGILATQPLINSLTDDNDEFISRVASILLKTNGSNLINILLPLLKNNDIRLRQNSTHLLGKLKDNRAIYPLVGTLKDSNSSVRNVALKSLLELKLETRWEKDKDVINKIIAALSDRDSGVRESALLCLYDIDDAKVIYALLDKLNDPNREIRKKVVIRLKLLRNPSHIDRIFDLIDREDDFNVEIAALGYLVNIREPKTDPFSKTILSDNNLRKICAYYKLFIRNSIAGSEKLLTYSLQRCSSIEMAEDFLNCGNPILKEAAEMYAKKKGYTIIPMVGTSSVHWNR